MNNKSKNEMALRAKSPINAACKSFWVGKNPIGPEKKSKSSNFSGRGKILRRKTPFIKVPRIPAIIKIERTNLASFLKFFKTHHQFHFTPYHFPLSRVLAFFTYLPIKKGIKCLFMMNYLGRAF